MRRYVTALILLLAAASALADSEARDGADFVRITALPCTDDKVLAHIPADERVDFRAAHAALRGVRYSGCWRPLFDKRVIFLRYEDGDAGIVPFKDLTPIPEA